MPISEERQLLISALTVGIILFWIGILYLMNFASLRAISSSATLITYYLRGKVMVPMLRTFSPKLKYFTSADANDVSYTNALSRIYSCIR